MTCPHCNHSFPLTWSRYFRAPLGKHTCPSCGRRAKFKLTATYLAVVLIAWLIFYGAAFLVIVVAFPGRWQRILKAPHAIAACVIGCVVLLPLDRVYDERFRRLEKLSDDTHGA